MKHNNLIIYLIVLLFLAFNLQAQDSTKSKTTGVQHGQHFVDKNGDGYNDNAPDHDGDGIPNGLDKDWLKLNKEQRRRHRFIDLDGDGINDNLKHSGNMGGPNKQIIMEKGKGSSMDTEQQKQNGQGQRKRGQNK